MNYLKIAKNWFVKVWVFNLGYYYTVRFFPPPPPPPKSFEMMPRYCANLKTIRYESTSLNRILVDKSHRVIVVLKMYIGLNIYLISTVLVSEKSNVVHCLLNEKGGLKMKQKAFVLFLVWGNPLETPRIIHICVSDLSNAMLNLHFCSFQAQSSVDVAELILLSYQKFGFITAENIEKLRNTQRLKVVQVNGFFCIFQIVKLKNLKHWSSDILIRL